MATYVRVRLGVETYALPVGHVKEVAELGTLTPVPGATASVLGVYNLRGAILPVYDLSAILGIDRSGPRSRLVVAETNGRRIGLAVSDIDDIAELSIPTEQTESSLLLGSAIVDDELVGFIDVNALFDILGTKEAV